MSSGHAFDPCREWLGIAAVDLSDPRKVLDLPPGDVTPLAVVHAADARLARLRRIDAGPFELARTSLITRVEEARDALLAAASQPPRPAGGMFAPPPPPGAGRVPPPMTPGRPDFPAEAGDDRSGDELAIRTGPRRVPSSGGNGTRAAIFSLACLAAAGIALAVFWPKLQDILGPKPKPRPGDTAKVGDSESTPRSTPVSDDPAQPETPDPPPDSGRDPAAPTPRMTPEPPPTEVREPVPATPEPSVSEPEAPHETPVEPPAAGAAKPPMSEAGGRAGATPTASDKAATAMLRRVLEAVQDDDFDAADTAVTSAEAAAETDEVFQRVSAWRQFATLARQAAGYRDQSLEAARDGGEYTVGDQTISVVEVSENKFAFKSAGRMHRLGRDEIPPAILLAILRTWFDADGRAANHVFLGVHLLARAKPDVAGARREWETARRRGEDTTPLEPLLDDPLFVEDGGR